MASVNAILSLFTFDGSQILKCCHFIVIETCAEVKHINTLLQFIIFSEFSDMQGFPKRTDVQIFP